MKIIPLYAILILMISCSSVRVLSVKERSVGEDWKISEEVAKKMIDRFNECGLFKPCHNDSKVVDPNNAEYKWLVSTYGKENVSVIDARYRQADQARYGELRGLKDRKENYKVRGYKTQLVKVVLPMGSMLPVTNYYDCFTVHPPPYNDQ